MGSWDAFRSIVRSDGVLGLWKGWQPNCLRAAFVCLGGEERGERRDLEGGREGGGMEGGREGGTSRIQTIGLHPPHQPPPVC